MHVNVHTSRRLKQHRRRVIPSWEEDGVGDIRRRRDGQSHRGGNDDLAAGPEIVAEKTEDVNVADVCTRADVVVEGGVERCWVGHFLAGNAEAFDCGALVAGAKGGAAVGLVHIRLVWEMRLTR